MAKPTNPYRHRGCRSYWDAGRRAAFAGYSLPASSLRRGNLHKAWLAGYNSVELIDDPTCTATATAESAP